MANTYGEPQRKYYHKNKDTIYRRTRKYKLEYNKEYYRKNKEVIDARRKLKKLEKLSQSLYKAVDSA